MITFKQIRFKNFMSYGNKETVLDLDFEGTRLILGENKDQPMESSNGAGKTQIINAIIYALFGKGIDGGLRSNEFINFSNKKNMQVKLSFSDGKREYEVIRARKPNKLDLTIDGESQTLDSMKNTDEMIEKIIGMNFDTFMTCFFLSPHRKNYMAMPPAEQRDLFETILSLDALSERAESVKELKKGYETDSKLLERDIEHAHQTNRMIEDELSRVDHRLDKAKKEHHDQIKQFKAELDDLGEFDEQTLRDLIQTKEEAHVHLAEFKQEREEHNASYREKLEHPGNLLGEISQLQFQISSIEEDGQKFEQFQQHQSEEIAKLNNELEAHELSEEEYSELLEQLEHDRQAKSEIKELESDLRASKRIIKEAQEKKIELEAELAKVSDSTCPTCGQHHVFDKSQIEDRMNQIDQLDKEIFEHEDAVTGLEASIHDLKANLPDLEGIEHHEIQNHLEDIRRIKTKIESVKNSDNPYKQVDKKYLNGLKKKLASAQKDHKVAAKEADDLSKKVRGIDERIAEIEGILAEVNEILTIADVHDVQGIDKLHKKKADLEEKIESEFDESSFTEEKDQIRTKFVDIDELTNRKKELSEKIEHAGILVKLLTDNKSFIRKNIVSRYVPFVNAKILDYSRKLGLNHHTVKIESDLSSTIEYMGESVSYFNMSAGERLRLQTAVAFSFRDLMSMMGREFNMMFVDELIDSGGDASMTELTMSFISNMTNALMISHKHEALEYIPHKDRIMVHKVNGFSRIV